MINLNGKALFRYLALVYVISIPFFTSNIVNASDIRSNLNEDLECQHSYQLKIKTRTEFEFQGNAVTRHNLEGKLSIRKLKPSTVPTKPGQWWGLQLTEGFQKANGQQAPLDPIYAIPFALLKDPKGRIQDFYFPGDWDKDQTDQLKGLAYYLQFSLESATREEQDTIGRFTTDYDVTPAKTTNNSSNQHKEIIKTKKAYLDFSNVSNTKRTSPSNSNRSNNGAFNEVNITDSEQRITTSECWFKSSRGKESLEITGFNNSYVMETHQSFKILALPNQVPAELWLLPANHQLWQIKKETKELSDEELKAIEEELTQVLKSTDILTMNGRQLASFLEQFDPAINTILDLIQDKQFSDSELKRLFNALGHLDTPNSNQLLMTAISEADLNEENRFRAMRAITQGTTPITLALKEQMIDLLQTQNFIGSDALRGSAIMSLGAVIQRREHNEHSDDVLYAIQGQMTTDTSPNERAAIAASLGNTGDERVLKTLAQFATDEHDRVRANVATSFGQIAHPEAKQILSDMLKREADNKPKQAAVNALRNFKLNSSEITSVEQVAKSSKSERTRRYAIQTLGAQTEHSEQIKSAMKRVMKTETSKRNFVQAAKILTQLQEKN